MKRSLHIAEELKEISSPVADIPFINTYTVQNGYFTQLYHEILLKMDKSNTYSVPDGYFDQLSAAVLNKIRVTATEENTVELAGIAPTLASLPRKNVYTAPEGYFDNLQIKHKEEARVIAIGAATKRKFVWVRYAVAACMIGIISLLALNFFNNKGIAKEDRIIAGTNVTYNEIKNLDVDQELEKISGAEMDTYLCDNGLVACNIDKDSDLVNELEELNMTDEELNTLLGETNN